MKGKLFPYNRIPINKYTRDDGNRKLPFDRYQRNKYFSQESRL